MADKKQKKLGPRLIMISTPIGNLGDISFRAVEGLRSLDVLYCEDTRRTAKLLNHLNIQIQKLSCPHFKERQRAKEIVQALHQGQVVGFVSDAGVPGFQDPGAILVEEVRAAGFPVEVIGGVSSLTHFISGLGRELDTFRYVGFLPVKKMARQKLIEGGFDEPTIFLESPHRIEKTLKEISDLKPNQLMVLAKELSKVSEKYFYGSAFELSQSIPSWKGEWIGIFWPSVTK